MMIRLFTENKNKDEVIAILGRHFDGFTVSEGVGYYKGQPEKSLIVDLMLQESAEADVEIANAVAEIGEYNNQESILVQRLQGAAGLAYRDHHCRIG